MTPTFPLAQPAVPEPGHCVTTRCSNADVLRREAGDSHPATAEDEHARTLAHTTESDHGA